MTKRKLLVLFSPRSRILWTSPRLWCTRCPTRAELPSPSRCPSSSTRRRFCCLPARRKMRWEFPAASGKPQEWCRAIVQLRWCFRTLLMKLWSLPLAPPQRAGCWNVISWLNRWPTCSFSSILCWQSELSICFSFFTTPVLFSHFGDTGMHPVSLADLTSDSASADKEPFPSAWVVHSFCWNACDRSIISPD